MRTHVFLGLIVWAATAGAWPVQTPADQQGPPQQMPWAGGEGEKSFEMPKSLVHPFPGPPISGGAEGANPKFPPQKPSGPWQQGPGSDPWSSFQSNQPFGMNMNSPADFGTQEQQTPFEQGVYPDNFPYTKPYSNHFPQGQYPQAPPPMPFPMSPNGAGGPPPQRPSMGMPPPPPQRQHPFGHMQMLAQNGPFDRTRVAGRSNSPEMPPPSSPFDTPGRYPIEYSPMKAANGSIPAITVQYNVTYTFTPWGWRTVDVAVSNATFHPTTAERVVEISGAPGGGLAQQPEVNKGPDPLLSWWGWPKNQGFEPNLKPTGEKPEEGTEAAGFGDPAAFPRPSQ